MKRTVLTVLALCALFAPAAHAQGIPAEITKLQAQINALQATVSALQTQLAAVQSNNALKLGPFVNVDPNPENGVIGPNITFKGANLHIVSGSNATDDNVGSLGGGLGNVASGTDASVSEIQRKPTENVEAYDLYLRAKASITNSTFGYQFGLNRQGFLDSITLLERATQLDPTFALAYCQIAFADGGLYAQGLDLTPERLRHYDNAVREALRLNPNLPEAHLAAGYYFYDCCRDYEQARAHLAVAESLLPNSSQTQILAGYIDRGQGRWADSTKAFERACNLDPENPLALLQLGYNYGSIRRYRDQETIYNRLIALQPDNPVLKLERAMISFNEKADLSQWRTALEALPSSLQNEPEMLVWRIFFFELSREWVKARELVRSSSSEELPGARSMVPRLCMEIPIAKYQGEHPETNAEFIESRDKLQQKVREHPKDPFLLCFLGLMDSYLGRNQEAISESKSAANMSQDPIDSPYLVSNLAVVYAITNDADLAFQVLDMSIKTPGGITYGELRLDPDFDPLRNDPRFDKLLAELAPRD
jgi:tetratricopeptide (TPR) repeat protein